MGNENLRISEKTWFKFWLVTMWCKIIIESVYDTSTVEIGIVLIDATKWNLYWKLVLKNCEEVDLWVQNWIWNRFLDPKSGSKFDCCTQFWAQNRFLYLKFGSKIYFWTPIWVQNSIFRLFISKFSFFSPTIWSYPPSYSRKNQHFYPSYNRSIGDYPYQKWNFQNWSLWNFVNFGGKFANLRLFDSWKQYFWCYCLFCRKLVTRAENGDFEKVTRKISCWIGVL